jgi:hypothetical protein
MARLRTLILAAGLAVSGAVFAHADSGVTGKWTYKVGATGTPCTLNLVAGGDAQPGENCPGGLARVGHWQTMGSNLQLLSPSGNIVGILHADGDGYVGKQIGGGRKIALSR